MSEADKGAGQGTRRHSSRADVSPFIVMDVMRKAIAREAAGGSVLHMEVGQPGTPAPWTAREAVRAALDHDLMGYSEAMGRSALRDRIARHYAETYGVDVSPDRIVITTGSSAGFMLSFLALMETGERCAIAEPGYPAYKNILVALGFTPALIATEAETAFQPTVEQLRAEAAAPGLRGLLVASPANPTGAMLSREALGVLVAACRDLGVTLISDEIYHGVTYGAPAETALAFGDDVIVINSFSKYYSMTGWRIGWMVVPEGLVRPIERLAQNLFIAPPAISQVAALAAFDAGEELAQNVALYARNRQILLAGLPEAGLTRFTAPDGAFYVYVDVSAWTDDSAALCDRLLEQHGIAATPGLDFDTARGHRYVRLSYAGSAETVSTTVERLKAFARNP